MPNRLVESGDLRQLESGDARLLEADLTYDDVAFTAARGRG